MDEVAYRAARVADVPGIQRVAREAWHAAYDDVLGAEVVEVKLGEWYDEDALEAAVTDDAQLFEVAVAEDVRGFANATRDDESGIWHLARLYVHHDHWNEGIGTGLLDRIEDGLRDRDVSTYRLAVLAGNTVGVRFYETHGFRRIDTEIGELAGVEVTECWYEKRL